jgi:hypothetical protein
MHLRDWLSVCVHCAANGHSASTDLTSLIELSRELHTIKQVTGLVLWVLFLTTGGNTGSEPKRCLSLKCDVQLIVQVMPLPVTA